MKTIPLLPLTFLILSASTGACLAPDDDMELELRAGDEDAPNQGGHDCDCPECWTLDALTMAVPLDHHQLESIHESGGQAVLRTQLESGHHVRFAIVIPPEVSTHQVIVELETGSIRTSSSKGPGTPIAMLSDTEIEEIASSLEESAFLWLSTSNGEDHELRGCIVQGDPTK